MTPEELEAELVVARQLIADLVEESPCARCGDGPQGCQQFRPTPTAARAAAYLATVPK